MYKLSICLYSPFHHKFYSKKTKKRENLNAKLKSGTGTNKGYLVFRYNKWCLGEEKEKSKFGVFRSKWEFVSRFHYSKMVKENHSKKRCLDVFGERKGPLIHVCLR